MAYFAALRQLTHAKDFQTGAGQISVESEPIRIRIKTTKTTLVTLG